MALTLEGKAQLPEGHLYACQNIRPYIWNAEKIRIAWRRDPSKWMLIIFFGYWWPFSMQIWIPQAAWKNLAKRGTIFFSDHWWWQWNEFFEHSWRLSYISLTEHDLYIRTSIFVSELYIMIWMMHTMACIIRQKKKIDNWLKDMKVKLNHKIALAIIFTIIIISSVCGKIITF